MEQILPGVWKLTLGDPESLTPVALRHRQPAADRLAQFPAVECPFPADAITGAASSRGYQLSIPLSPDEQVYGLGLQLLSFNQRGLKKTLRVNSDPKADTGDSHAPVPFYISTAGYGVLIDTARYLTMYMGCTKPVRDRRDEVGEGEQRKIALSTNELYSNKAATDEDRVIAEVPIAQGVDVYIFAGPTMREAVQRYNLFSGGGCLPPRWGLGPWYRVRGDFDQQQTEDFAAGMRADAMPCDVLGLEPGWHSHAYSCTYVWSDKFPEPGKMVAGLGAQGYHVNLWEHAFVHAASPIYGDMLPYAGDYEVWKGLVPDFTIPAARQVFANHHEQAHIALGVSGYKLDECDNSDFISFPWSYPEISRFPSGLDGEQMHSLMGLNYQETIEGAFRRRGLRTYSEVRSAHALAAPYPFVLYSDLYEHRDFIRGVANCGFSGLLWCPEVRHAVSVEDLIRRLQAVAVSPQALVNAWYIKNAPWKQWDTEANNADRLAEGYQEVENACREILRLRMQLIPYLYAAFFRYQQEGVPPFRALVMDYPDDPNVYGLDDHYLIGDRLLAAPVTAGVTERKVYLPAGDWYDFWTGERYTGGQTITYAVPLNIVPLFVKAGAVLPLAVPTLHTDDPASWQLTVRVYGDGQMPATLVEDDGITTRIEEGVYNTVTLAWQQSEGTLTREETADVPHYTVVEWQTIA